MTTPVVVATRRWTERACDELASQFDVRLNQEDHPLSLDEVRLRCGWALQKFEKTPEVENLLVKLLMTTEAEDPEHWIKYNAALALGRQGNQKAKSELQSMLAGHNPPNVRQSAAHVYLRVAQETDEGFVRTFANDKDPIVRKLMRGVLTELTTASSSP